MNINATLFDQFIFLSMFIVGGLSYYLGKRKTATPKVATLIGVLLCITPPLNIVYLIVLMLKNDVTAKQTIVTSELRKRDTHKYFIILKQKISLSKIK